MANVEQALLFYDENHPMKGGQLRPEPVSTNERSCCITSHQSNDGTKTKGSCLLFSSISELAF